MTTKEAIEKYSKEIKEIITGARYQGFISNNAEGIILENIENEKEEILKEIEKEK